MRAEPKPGDTFAGHLIEEEIGRGGMGIVFRAHDVALDRRRAVKVVAPELSADPAFAARFRREARLAASVEHPNVVTVHRAGDEEGLLYIVMRYVDGVDLARLIADGALPPKRALAILRPVASALDAAHHAGLVHRDVKPANVLLEDAPAGERVYLTDFGISKPLEAARPPGATATTALTASGQVIGTADYVSPEAIEGDEVDARSDVYSLACLAFHLLTGRPPFPRERELATLVAHTKAPRPSAVESNPALPRGIDRVLARGMAISPEERPASAGELVGQIAAELGEESSGGSRRRPLAIAAALAVAVAIAVALTLLLGGGGGSGAEEQPAVEVGPVGAGPVGVAVGEQRIWVASRDADELGRLRRDRPVEAKPPIPIPDPRSVAVGLGSVWVVNGEALYRVDSAVGEDPQRIEVGAGPIDVVVDNQYVWVASEEDQSVTRLDPFDPAHPETIELGSAPHEIAAAEGAVWVTTPDAGTIQRVSSSPTDPRVTKTVDVGTEPTSLAIGPSSVWVADNGEGMLRQVDRETNEVSGAPIEVAPKPRAVAIGFGSIWVASGGSGVVERIDPETGARVGDPIEVGEGPSSDPADLAIGDAAVYSADFGDSTVTRITPRD